MKNRSRPAVRSDVGPFAIVPMWLLEAGVSGNAIRVYAALAGWYADRNDGRASPSRSTLAKRIGVSKDTVDRGLRDLEEIGAIEIRSRYEDGDETGSTRQTSNEYVVRFVRLRGRESAEGGSRESAAHPGRESAEGGTRGVQEREPIERDLPAAPEYDPVKGRRVDGRDLPWDALAAATSAYGEANGPRMKRALSSIRKQIVEDAGPGTEIFLARFGWQEWERAVAAEIEQRAGRLIRENPTLTYGPEGIARNWAAARTADVRSIVEDVRRAS